MADIKETNIKEDVERLKEWYSKQLHLPQNIDEYYFYNFVCGTNSLEKAKRKMDAYFSLRKKCVELPGIRTDSPTYRNMLKAFYTAVLPDKTPEGYRVIVTMTAKTDPAYYNVDAYFQRLLLLADLAVHMWPTDLDYIALNIYSHVPLQCLKTMNLMHAAAFAKFWSEACPVKLKSSYIMNTPNILLKVEPLLRSFLSKKLSERIHICHDDSKVKETLPVSMLPAEYGGEGKSMKEMSDYWTELMDSKASWYEEKLKLCSDENKRGKDSAWKGKLDFGIDGSFKKIDFD